MKKGYAKPEAEVISVKLTDDVLFHSEFEYYGKNKRWTWNDNDDVEDDFDGLFL